MVRLLISLVIKLAANAVGLLVAAAVLDGMSVHAGGFVVAVLIFTGVEVVAEPLLAKLALTHVRALMGGVALVTSFVGLVVTDVLSVGLHVHGVSTWVLASLIVWLAALVAGLILPVLFVKNRVEERRGTKQ